MIDKIASAISDYLVRADACDAEDKEVVFYGLTSILSNAIQILVLLIVSLLLGVLPAMAVFSLFYAVLRRYIGGAHASTQLGCLCMFTAIATLGTMLGLYIPIEYARAASLILTAFATVVVFVRAPVTHPNAPKSEKAIRRLKKTGHRIAMIELLAVALGVWLMLDSTLSLVSCASLGGLAAAITLLVPNKERGGKKE